MQKLLKNKILVFLLSVVLLFCFQVKTVEHNGATYKYFLFLGKEVLQIVRKNGKVITFLLFGCGFYTLGEFKRKFIFWREVWNNELDILEG